MRFTECETRLGLMRLIVSTHRLSKPKLVRSPPHKACQGFIRQRIARCHEPADGFYLGSESFVCGREEPGVARLPMFTDVKKRDRTPESHRGDSAESRKVHFFIVRDDGVGPESAIEEGVKETQKHTASISKDKYASRVLIGGYNEGGTPEWEDGSVLAPNLTPQGVHLAQEQLGGEVVTSEAKMP
ncbi:hypothetical protein RB213_004778 [Colletotrichum asianum]